MSWIILCSLHTNIFQNFQKREEKIIINQYLPLFYFAPICHVSPNDCDVRMRNRSGWIRLSVFIKFFMGNCSKIYFISLCSCVIFFLFGYRCKQTFCAMKFAKSSLEQAEIEWERCSNQFYIFTFQCQFVRDRLSICPRYQWIYSNFLINQNEPMITTTTTKPPRQVRYGWNVLKFE